MNRADRLSCRCNACVRFRGESWNAITCDLCDVDDRREAPWIPDLLKSFLKVSKICIWCRNGINAHVGCEWRLCWGESSDESLKWAMLDWVRSMYWLDLFRLALDGFASRGEYYRKRGHSATEKRKPLEDEVACVECGRWFYAHPNTLRCPKCKKAHEKAEAKRRREWNKAVRIVLRDQPDFPASRH